MMNVNNSSSRHPSVATSLIIIVILLAIAGFFTYKTISLNKKVASLEQSVQGLQVSLKATEDTLNNTKIEKDGLQQNLDDANATIEDYEKQAQKNNKTISKLKKLTTIDPELLKKYSKVYFLSENYAPESLTDIDSDYIIDKTKKEQFLTKAWPFLHDMLDDAANDGVDLRIASAYRSFSTQASLKTTYKVIYGAGTANQFSADQGYSEHQMGTAVDFNTSTHPNLTIDFEKTDAYNWLSENAYKYGFILSYPKGNSYYQYEPWHWRFVGKDLARDLNRNHQNFYDLDQREIDDYLVTIFDK